MEHYLHDEKTDLNDLVLEVVNLKQYFPIKAGLMQRVVGHVKAVDGLALRSNAARRWASLVSLVVVKRPLERPFYG